MNAVIFKFYWNCLLSDSSAAPNFSVWGFLPQKDMGWYLVWWQSNGNWSFSCRVGHFYFCLSVILMCLQRVHLNFWMWKCNHSIVSYVDFKYFLCSDNKYSIDTWPWQVCGPSFGSDTNFGNHCLRCFAVIFVILLDKFNSRALTDLGSASGWASLTLLSWALICTRLIS